MSYITTNYNTNTIYGTKDIGQLISRNTISMSVTGTTNSKKVIPYNGPTTIYTNGITASIDGQCNNGNQVYTFGPAIPGMWVAVGQGTSNTMAYSTDGINWIGLGISIFSIKGRDIAWNGTMWVAVGQGTNSIAYSYNGINWTGLGTICQEGLSVMWNGTMWLVGCVSATVVNNVWVANTTNPCFVWSNDGINWNKTIDNSLFTLWTMKTMWNGTMWVAAGQNVSSGNIIAYSNDGKNWTPATTGGTGGTGGTIFIGCFAVVWNGTMWIVGGGGNTGFSMATSLDGKNWIGVPNTSSIIGNVYGIAWNGKMFVAVGETTNTIAYSYDGFNWTRVQNSLSIFIRSDKVYWNGTMWVAIGITGGGNENSRNTIVYSYDGINWTGAPTSTGIFLYGFGIAYNNKRANTITFPRKLTFAVGNGTSKIAFSYDGITWTPVTTNIFTNYCNGVAWNSKMWIAVGDASNNSLAYSYNGINWVGLGNSIFTNSGKGVAWNGSMWVAVGYTTNNLNNIAISYDGINWIPKTSPFTSGGNGVIWTGTMWITVGQGTNTIAYSYDGITWTPGNNSPFTYGRGVAWNGKMGIAVGEGTTYKIAWSTDGKTWTGVTSPFTTTGWGVAWNGTMWVAVGQGTKTIAYSYDGITWTETSTSPFTTTGYGVVWNGSIWVAGGYGGNNIAWSSNGINWYGLSITNSDIRYGVACNNTNYNNSLCNINTTGILVAVGEGTNTIMWSTDGILWYGLGNSIFTNSGNGVTNNGSMWVAVGDASNNSIAYSYDGKTWNGLGKEIFSTTGNEVAWNGSMWVAVGTGTNRIAYSYNGIDWYGVKNSPFTNGRGVAWNGTTWIAVGNSYNNTIAYSYNGINWVVLGDTFGGSKMNYGMCVAWNGTYWVVGGSGNTGIWYTTDISGNTGWTMITNSITSRIVNTILWTGTLWMAGDNSGNIITPTTTTNMSIWKTIYSDTMATNCSILYNNKIIMGGNNVAYTLDNGTTWNSITNPFTVMYGLSCIQSAPIQLSNYNTQATQNLEIVSDSYYNTGYTNMSVSISNAF